MNRQQSVSRTSARAGIMAAILLAAVPSVAFAQSVERSVEGWSSTGNEVVVHLEQRGERMVDGVSKDYYFEATEVYGARDGKLLQRYKDGAASGDPPVEYTDAKPEALAAKLRETMGHLPAAISHTNPSGTFRLVSVTSEDVRAEGANFRCVTRHRVGLLDRSGAKVFTIRDAEYRGESRTRRDAASCPEVQMTPAWQPQGVQWAALLRVDDETTLLTGAVANLDDLAHADVVRQASALAALVPQGPARTAWEALADGDLEAAQAAFEAITTSDGALGAALVAAYGGDKKARKAADKAFGNSDKKSWELALRAATYLVAGDADKAARWIDDAIEKADGFDTLRRMAALFELVNLSVANQLAVHALSDPGAAKADTAATWALLVRGLLDSGAMRTAKETLAKIEKPNHGVRVLEARLALVENQLHRAADLTGKLVFESPGHCEALLLRGRYHAARGDNGAARELFESAAFCDPNLGGAVFYTADFDRLAGEHARARERFQHYLDVTLPRGGDLVAEVRREAAKGWVGRLGHEGVVLVQSSCQRSGGAYLCRGTLVNTADTPAAGVSIEVKQKKKKVAAQAIEQPIGAGESRPFGLRIDAGSLDGAVLRAGRNAEEMSVNETPIR